MVGGKVIDPSSAENGKRDSKWRLEAA